MPMPENQPIKGINAWKKAKENDIVRILFTFNCLIVNPLDIDTAKESMDKPIEINIIDIVSILGENNCK